MKSSQLLRAEKKVSAPAEGCKFRTENSKDIRSHQQVQMQNKPQSFFFLNFRSKDKGGDDGEGGEG